MIYETTMSRSVKKAIDILMFLANHQGEINLSEISRAMSLDKATVYRYLTAMESIKVVEKRNNCYFLGLTLFELGSKVPVRKIIVNKIHPILQRLCLEVNETVNLGVFHNNTVLYLDKIESNRSLQIQTTIGSRTPLYCTAMGKSILSILPGPKRDKTISELKLVRKTGSTITDKKKLIRQIEQIKEDSFSVDNEELEEGLKCIAVPLSIENLDFFGSISISGPSIRFNGTVQDRLSVQLGKTQQAIKQVLKNE